MPDVTNHPTIVRISKNDGWPVIAPFQNCVPAVQTKSAPMPLIQSAVAFIAIIRQNRSHFVFKKLKVLRICINQIHTNNTAYSKCFD